MPDYDVQAKASSPVEVVWRRLPVDSRTWPAWPPLDELVEERSELKEDGTRAIGGVHASRVGDNVDGERLTELVPLEKMSYEAVWNGSMHDYSASIELWGREDGTQLSWRGTYEARPELAEILPPFLRDFMQRMVDGLARHADHVVQTAP
jgi:carbon monoxide dehydrogenase subunit G